jgi:hypothetical protein
MTPKAEPEADFFTRSFAGMTPKGMKPIPALSPML